MLKRIRWLMTGMAIALGGQVWVKRKVRTVGARYGVDGIAEAAANRARAALEEGRAAMRQREAELRGGTRDPAGRPARRP